ncbi:MAG TPA: T9SS type A sorting domain-containing protein, partial [Chitinophagaceae bacterium]
RIKQVDFNGTAKYSEVRAVRGFGQNSEIIVYPVPSLDGRVNVVFDDAKGTRDVSLIDMSGRMLRQWKALTSNTFQIDNLRQGVYTLRIQNVQTGEVAARKLIVTRN